MKEISMDDLREVREKRGYSLQECRHRWDGILAD